LIGCLVGYLGELAARRGVRSARRRIERPILRGEWVTAACLAFANGTNDAQKTMGVITTALVAAGVLSSFAVPLWVKVACATALTVGSALGGWRIVRTIGQRIFRIKPLDGLVSQGSSAALIGTAAFLGAPVSTTHVVASSVVGVGAARRWRHVRWPVVREILLAWLVTMPCCAGMAGTIAGVWRIAS
jgi:PiT family inorganic phosphate transporter